MKRCPTCNRTYADETLRFCLDDGLLLSDSDDSEATKVIPTQQALNLPATQVWQYSSQYPQQARASHNSILTYAVVALVVLLALLVGGGAVWLLMPTNKQTASNTPSMGPSPSPLEQEDRPAVPSQSQTIDRNSSSSTSNRASSSTSNQPLSSMSNYESAEARIANGQSIGMAELAGMAPMELKRLRNAVYARHGRMFNTPELQRYFDSRPWYTRRFDYSDRDLTSTDKANLNLIMASEKGAR